MNPKHSRLSRRRWLQLSLCSGGLCSTAFTRLLNTPACAEENMPYQFRYALCNELLDDRPLEQAFALIADCGYEGVEIAPFTIAANVTNISPARRSEVRRLAERNGLKIIGLHWLLAKTQGLHLTSSDQAVRRRTAEYLMQLARFCADLGGTVMVFGSPKQRSLAEGISQEEGLQYAADVFRMLMPELDKAQVTLALEPLAPTETNFLTTAAEAMKLIRLVDSPRCRLQLDCKAMSSESEPIPTLIRCYAGEMVHFHANDPNLQGPGFGRLDFKPIMATLAEVSYRGWVSVEVFDYSPGREHLTRESLQNLRRAAGK